MVARNGKSVMELVRFPILRPLLHKHEILRTFESSKNLKDLYSWVARLAINNSNNIKVYLREFTIS